MSGERTAELIGVAGVSREASMDTIRIEPIVGKYDKGHEPPRGWDRIARLMLLFLIVVLSCAAGLLAVGGGLVTERIIGDVPDGFFPAADLMRWTARHTILWTTMAVAIPPGSFLAMMRIRQKASAYLVLVCAFLILATLTGFLGYSYLRSHNFSHIRGIQA